ncbi:MAG: hypothetical protein A3I31_03265 [Candidatus Colwellbacteria bacterium RIFCSPLOWO2_02_FULL_44_20b]|uniref:Uncharacterized protein n=1 Tax=Candidatus Colwellbacteria bacterium RIFCSPLOWO2_02_FULL_44_20b TaxID=1797691 RepID=A0A1G1Z881_9BACT|nr:MAG: hypothetical protein A3I31_03265 [Candidatus Colwellbacteria bacterium RIFCSPLOWO2_02_FULL_44_20b]
MLQGSSLPFLAIHLISALVMLFYAVLVFLHNRKELANKIFIVMMIGTIGWSLANIGTFNVAPENFGTTLNIALIFASLQTLSLPIFVYLFPQPSFAVKKSLKIIFVIFAIIYSRSAIRYGYRS